MLNGLKNHKRAGRIVRTLRCRQHTINISVSLLTVVSYSPGGVLLGILRGSVPPGSPNPDPISKKSNFPQPFPDLVWTFLSNSFGNEATNTFIHLRSSLKTIPDSRPKWQNAYPFADRNGAKTLPFGTAHTYLAHTREYPPGLRYVHCSDRGCLFVLIPGADFVSCFRYNKIMQGIDHKSYRAELWLSNSM